MRRAITILLSVVFLLTMAMTAMAEIPQPVDVEKAVLPGGTMQTIQIYHFDLDGDLGEGIPKTYYEDGYRYADTKGPGGKCDIPVNFVLEEFPNIGSILDINKKLNTVRSRNINVSIIFQSIAGIKNRYPFDVWQEIIGCMDTQLFLGCSDPLTATYVSDFLGDATVAVGTERYTKSPIMRSPVYQDMHSVGKRKLMTPDEVLRLPNEQALVMIRGNKPLKVKKLDYTRYPQAKELVKSNAADHVPLWRGGYQPPRSAPPSDPPKPGIVQRIRNHTGLGKQTNPNNL